jgi:hypothetical protein
MKKIFGLVAFAVILIGASVSASAESFTASLTGAQEVPAVASTGFGGAQVIVNPTAGTLTFKVTFNGLTSAQTLSHIHAPAPIGASAAVIINFGTVGGTSGTIQGSASITAGQLAQLRSGQGYVNVHSANFPNGELRGQLLPARPVDYDGDGRTDYSVLRFPNVAAPAQAPITWYNLNSSTGQYAVANFGDVNAFDFPAPGDYDGDGKADIALFRSTGVAGSDTLFLIIRSSDTTFQAVHWGTNGDINVSRDFDGDGTTNFAVYRATNVPGAQDYWFIRRPDGSQLSVPWGVSGDGTNTKDVPVTGDYDGDGKFDYAVYRFKAGDPYNNCFIVQRSSDNGVVVQPLGDFSSDYVVPGDYDGDGKTDYCVARTSAQAATPVVWYVLQSSNGAIVARVFGRSDDIPIQGDYDGDGKTDVAMYRRGATAASNSTFYVHRSFSNTDTGQFWGLRADFPVATFDAR